MVLDFVGRKNGYYPDTTRCVFVGEPDEEFQEAYEVLRRAQEAGVRAARPGAKASDVDGRRGP